MGSFSFNSTPPTLTVAAAYSKHRREDTIPLHPDLVSVLGPWLSMVPPSATLWPGRWAKDNAAWRLIKHDLEAARESWIGEAETDAELEARRANDFLAYRDADDRTTDFHSLWHRFVTELVKAGVQPKDAKELARHSSTTLTMDRYVHVAIRDTAAAVGKLTLPPTGRPEQESTALRAAGTDPTEAAYVPRYVPVGGSGRGLVKTND
jgi:hypothetical protein